MLRIIILSIAFSLAQITCHVAAAQATAAHNARTGSMSEDQKVQQLLDYIRTLEGATFIRNDSEFSPEKAAGHLSSKWQKHASKIKTAEGFVLKLASESSSGKPYSIRFADGTTHTTREVLLRQLQMLATH